MVRKMLRQALREFLAGDNEDEEEENERPTPEGSVVIGPHGPAQVPPGVNPIQFIIEQIHSGNSPSPQDGGHPSHSHHRPVPTNTPTMRNGPTGSFFDLKEIDCSDMHPIEKDPEVQALLTAGWEPFSVRQISALTGFQGVRVYFRKQLHS